MAFIDRRNNRTHPREYNYSDTRRWDPKTGALAVYGRCTEERGHKNTLHADVYAKQESVNRKRLSGE